MYIYIYIDIHVYIQDIWDILIFMEGDSDHLFYMGISPNLLI